MTFGIASVFVRYLFTLWIMFAFYNPSGRSFYHWVSEADAPRSVKVFVGCLMITGFMILGGATIRSLGYPGLFGLIIILTTLGGTIIDLGFVDTSSGPQLIVAIQGITATGLTIGLCWSTIRARLTGQVDSDDVSRRI
jgi:hypothetical protein